MEPPSFPAGGPQVLRATPGSDAAIVFPLPSGSPPFQFEWSRAGAKLSERFTSSHNAGGVRLSISAARTGDSGVYTLQASNAAGKDTTRVRLEVSPDEMPTGDDPPTFLRRLQDLTVKVGTRTRFLVEIVSSTECRVTWYRNERRLMEAERIALVRDGNFWCADISAVSVDDAGRWTCTAENIGGRASCSAHLNVLVPKAYKRPEFVEELRALLTEQGTVSLECKVVGVPTPVLRWFKDSREIKAGDVFALTANAEDPTSLGTYTCEAVNCMGRAYSSSKVQVVGRSSREGSTRPSSGGVMLEPPPIFTKELEDQFVRICDRLTLSCQIVVPPWPRTVVWYNKEGKVESNDKYHILEDGVGGYFIEIQTSEFPDEGEWKCVATSTGGRVGISTCYVSMDIPKNYRKPRFMENLQAVLTEEGLVSFECKVVGFPTPVLSWFKDGQELKPGDVYQLTGTNSLGSYCCIARNFMGQASSSAELTVEDIQNQLNEEEKLQLFSKNQAPKYLQGLKSVEAKIDEPFRFTIKVAIPPEPTVLWYRDEQPVDESSRCHLGNEERGSFFLDIQNLEFMDQAEWKCVAMNDYGQSVTSCFLKLVIPRHYKKPRFLENLQAILSDEGAVNLECKVIGVPQPVLKWYKDGEELKPGDIHRIISGQDGTCCLGTYTCEAQNCMGIAASSASLLGFEDSLKAKNKKKADDQTLQRNLSLSTIHEERTSQMYDTPVGDITLDDKGEISFSFDGKEVSVSLYETPDLTEEEALQIVEMYADQLSENVTEHNVVELPPLRFVKETSTSGNLLMEAIIIDVSPEYFTSPEEDLRTEADIEDISIADENGPPQLSLDQDVSGQDYLEKTMALLSEERADISKKIERKKSDSQKSVDDYFSLSRDRSSSEEKKDDDTQVLSESDLQSFASAHSTEKPKSKSSKPSLEDGQESSDITKTVLLKEDFKAQFTENVKSQKERRGSRGSRRSTSSEKSPLVIRKELLEIEINKNEQNKIIAENIKIEMMSISSSLTQVMNAIQIIERDIILKSELMSVAATASRSLEIINSLITPLSEIHSITDTITETENENETPEIIGSLFNRLPQTLGILEQSLTIVEKCIDYESDNKTLVKKTCVSLIETCGDTLIELITALNTVAYKEYNFINDICIANIKTTSENILKTLKSSADASKQEKILNEIIEDKIAGTTSLESKHLHHTQKVLYALKSSLKSVLSIIGGSDAMFKSIADIKNAEIILDEISTPIQELQNALEQIETLSVAESDSNLPKFNTEIIESVINSVLKLRTAFEQLSTDKENMINEVLLDIKQNILSISSQIDLFEEKNGKFDILHNDNKLEVLQTMAQILISLENSLPILDTIPNLKTNMADFHKNLTKVLENVIEGNDSTKYFTLLEICSAISRINTSLNNMESRQVPSLAIISNTLKIIQKSVNETIFENSLNKSVLKNINDLLLDIQETINQVEEATSHVESEKVDDLSIKVYEENKLITVLEQVQKTIASMSKVVYFENVENFTIAQVFENIHPILTEIQCCVASLNVNTIEHSENVADMTISSFTEAIAHPLCELHQNISVLNQVICEIAKNQEVTQFTAFAEPLLELQTTLEILQAEVVSQYEEVVQCPEIIGSIANSVDNLQSCILKIQEHDVLEVVDDMSTLDDISGIKTTADILLPNDQYMISSIENIKIGELPVIHTNASQEYSAQALQTINKYILSLQDSVITKNVKALPDSNENLPIKSLIIELQIISSDIKDILQPITMEEHKSLNPSKLISLVKPLEHLQESLSVVNPKNISFYENVGELSETQVFTENLLNLKVDLDVLLNILRLAAEAVDVAIDTAAKRVALQQLPEKLEILLSEYIDFPLDKTLKIELTNLRQDVLNALTDTNISNNINEEEVNEIIEKVNKSISKVQDEGFNCTAQSLNILSHESKLAKTLCEMEQCIATLEPCDLTEEFVTLTSESNNEISQIACDSEVDPLIQLDRVTKIMVNAIYNESKEGPENDIKLAEEFVDTFSKELSLLRYLIKNHPSPKQVIKLIQVFYALLRNLNDYKSRYHYTLSDEFNTCLKASLYDMEYCFKNIKSILVNILHSQSQLLFDIPQTTINDGEQFLKNVLQSKNDMLLHTTYSVILNIIESSKPFNDNLKNKMIEELSRSEDMISQQDDAEFNDNYHYLASFLTAQAKNSLENPLKHISEKLLHVIKKHEDVNDILGIGRRIIYNQCISDCIDILKQYSEECKVKDTVEKCIPKEINIDEVLLEISEPLDFFNTQIINIRNKILLSSEKDSNLTELKTLESHVNIIREANENIKLCISNNGLSLDNNDIALVMELNNKIHLIYNNLRTLESTPVFETIKLVVNPIEEIEKNLNLIISHNKDLIDKKSQNNKEKAEALLQKMEQHIEIIEIVEEVSAVIKLDDLKETASIVRELRGSIAGTESAIDSGVEECSLITTDQIPLTDKLQKALISLQSQALDSAQQDTVNSKEDIRQQVIDAVSDLQNNLNQLTNISLQNKLENINNAQTDITQEENNHIDLNKSNKQSEEMLRNDEIRCELMESDQIIQNTGDVAEQDLNLSKISEDLQKNIPECKLLQEPDVKNLQVEKKCESESNLSSSEIYENVCASKSLIEIVLENIQEYLSQDITDIAKQFGSCLNYEAIKITQDISQKFYEDSDRINCLSMETTGSLIISDEQLNILSNLHENLDSIITYESATELGEVVVEDKFIQFKNVAKNLCQAIQNLNISTNTTIKADKSEELAIESPDLIEPKTEVDSSLSEHQIFSSNYAEQKSNNVTSNITDNEVVIRDSKLEELVNNKNVDENIKERLEAREENLVHYISEYVSEEVTEILRETLPVLNPEHFEKSHQIANQLFTLCKVTNFDEANIFDLLKEKSELTIQLNESITLIHNEFLDETKDLPALFERDKLQRINSVLKNLADSLKTYLTYEQNVAIEQIIELDKSKQEVYVELLKEHKTEQNVVEVEETADLVCKIKEVEILSTLNKKDNEMFTHEMSKCTVTDKPDDTLINNEIIECEQSMILTDHENETNSIQKLDKLLQEVNDYIDLSLTNVEYSEIIQNNLEEVQSVIIKLKYDFDGTANDALNETLEDLECNVRSVQLQINEQSPPVLLKEACSNLQVIVASLNNIEDVKETAMESKINTVINNCSEEADQTIQLLNKACGLEKNSKLDNIISRLNNVKDIMKSLRTSFVGDAETLILKGIDVIKNLNQVEETIFSLEKDMDKIKDIDANIKDNIITAIHSVYGSISNMRGAISSIQKRYMYENYGKPSQNLLKSIKNFADISQLNIDNKSNWKNCAKIFRNVLNHFEDIKFYINFDRTARIPNDAAFTKIILRETIGVLEDVKKLHNIHSDVGKTVNGLTNYINNKNLEIEERTTLEVKEKIPIFIDISVKILEATEFIKLQLQGSTGDGIYSKFIQTDDKEQKLTDDRSVIRQSKEVQETFDLNLESTEFVSLDRENEELVNVTTEGAKIFQEASKMESIAVVQNLLNLQEYQTNDNDQMGRDKEQVIENMMKEDEIMKILPEDLKEGDIEKGVQLQEDIGLTSFESHSVEDVTHFTDISNVITTEIDTAKEQNVLTREEIRDSRQEGDSLINIDKCEVLIANLDDNVKAEVDTTLKIQDGCKSINNELDSEVKEKQVSDLTLESIGEPSEQLTKHTIVTKDIQLNEEKGKENLLENTIQVGLLSNSNLEADINSSIIEEHQTTNTSIERNLNIQEKKTITEILPMGDKETERNKRYEQSHENILLKNEEKDLISQISKDDTNEPKQLLNLSEQPANSEPLCSDVITDNNKSNDETLQNQMIKKEQKLELFDDNSMVKLKEKTLPNEAINVQETKKEPDKDLNKKDDVMDTDNLNKSGVYVDKLNAEANLAYLSKDTDESLIDEVEELRTDDDIRYFKEQGVFEQITVASDTLKVDDVVQKDGHILDSQDLSKSINKTELNLKDKNIETVTVNTKYDKGKDEEYFDHSEVIVKELNEAKTNEEILSSIKDKVESNEDIKKSDEQSKELILIPEVEEKPPLNVQTDLSNKETEETNSYSCGYEKGVVNNNEGNDILNIIKGIDINQIVQEEQSDIIEGDFTANTIIMEEYLNVEHKATVSEISENDNKKVYQESVIIKDVIIKDDESSIDNEKKEEYVKSNQPEPDIQIVYSELKEKDVQKPNVKVQSDLENKEATESKSEIKETTEIKPESNEKINAESYNVKKPNVNVQSDLESKEATESKSKNKETTEVKPGKKEVIDSKSYESDKKAPFKKHEENKLVNVLQEEDIHQIKEQEQSNNKEAVFPADTKVKKGHSDSEHKVMVTEILETDDKKDDQESITLKKDVINKENKSSIYTEKQEESVKCNQTLSDNQIVFSESIVKDVQKPNVNVQSYLENKETTEVKPESKDVIESKSDKSDVKAPINKNEEKQLINILEGKDLHLIKEQEQSTNVDENFPEDSRVKKEQSRLEQKAMEAEILEKYDKKDDQQSITLKKDVINKNNESLICKTKQEESAKSNPPESDNQIVLSESIEKDIQKPNVEVQSDLENKEATESKSEIKETTEIKPESNEKINAESYNVQKPNVHVQSDLESKEATESKSKNKEATEVKPEKKEVIDSKSNKSDKKAPAKKNKEKDEEMRLKKEQEQSVNEEAYFPGDTRVKKELSRSEEKVLVTEILEMGDKKGNQESITLKKDVVNKNNESSICKAKQEESTISKQPESDTQIVLNKSIEKDIQKPNVESNLENKEVTDSKSENKESTEVKSERKEDIELKAQKSGKKDPVKKNKEKQTENIVDGKDIHEIKEQLQSDTKEENIPADTRVKKKYSESEHKAMGPEIFEKDNKKDDAEIITSKEKPEESVNCNETGADIYLVDENTIEQQKEIELVDTSEDTDAYQTINKKQSDKNDDLNKDDESTICLKQEEPLELNKTESDYQAMFNVPMKKEKETPRLTMQSDLDNTETKDIKYYPGVEKAPIKKSEENDLVNIIKETDKDQIKDQEKSVKNEDNLTLDTIVKKENSESAQKSTLTEISENYNKKEDQESIKSNENYINKYSEICKERLKESMECNKTESDNQVLSSESISKEQLELHRSVQSGLGVKQNDEIKSYPGDEKAINQENIICHQVAASEDQDVKYKESSVNIRSDSEKKKIDEAVTIDKQSFVKNGEAIEKADSSKNVHEKQLETFEKELDTFENTETDHARYTPVEKKNIESNKTPVVVELGNSTTIDTQGKESINVEICELKANVENQDAMEILDGINKKENENVTAKKGGIEVMDQTMNIQEISTIKNNLPLINVSNDTFEENKSKSLETNKNDFNLDNKCNEENIKQQEINKKNGKKKQKPDKKKILEEQKENNGEKCSIGNKSLTKEKYYLVKNEENKLFDNPPMQVEGGDEKGNVINTGENAFSAEEYKSKSTEHKKYKTEEIKSRARDISYSNTANTKEFITTTEKNEDREYLVFKKSAENTSERIEFEREKYRPKESPTFIDHNKTDYTLQFPRPPNYTSKTFDYEELVSSELNLLNRAPIYKAQTLMHDYQTRSSYSPHIDQIDQSSYNYDERVLARSRSKAVSEARSTTSEKRPTRDLKRKPVFSTFLTDRTAVESSRVKLTCSILSSSDPTITWYKNGTLLEDKQKFRSKFIDGLITLEVLNAIPNDSGEFSCTVENEYGSITSSANLKVYPSFEASPIPPTFTRSIRDVYHSLENELVLECRIRGQPLPSITWYKDDKPITLCERYQAHYLADGVCRLTVSSPSKEDSGKYTCHAESSIWSDQIYHNVQFTDKESCVSPNIFTLEKVRLNRQVLESRKPHFTNVISDCKVVSGGTIGLQVEIKGSPTRVEWLREGCSVTDTYRNAQTYVDHGIYTLALTDVTEKESGLYTCRAWSNHGNVDMNASIIVVQPNQIDGKPAVIVSRPTKDVLISVGEDINISFRVQGEPKAKVIFMKGLRDITHSQRVCKMTSDDYIKFTLKRSVVSDAGTYCVLARNAYGCDRAFVTVVIRQRASSENLVSDWTYPMDDLAISALDRNYKAVPDRIPSEPSVVDGGKNWVSLAWPKPDCQSRAPILAYKVESWLIGKEGGARWAELGITPRNSFDAFNLKQEEEYHFRVTPRNRYGWGESVQTTSPIGIGLTGDRPEFVDILPGQLKVLLGETATLCCTFKGKPTPEILWMKNGHDIEEDTDRVKITLNSYKASLNIENVKVEDEGRYSCEASNIHGRSSTYARMTVITDRKIWEADAKLKRERSSGVEGEYPPQFTMRLRDRRVQATYPVRLTCQVIGSPSPVLTWFKNGEQATADGRHNMSQDEYFYTLEIAPTTLDDGGVYEAMARNSSGAISCRCSLVVDKGIRAYVAPEFCCGLEPLYQLREGEELRISAVVEAYPSVGVSWYRDGVRLRPSRRAIMTLDRDGQIELALASVTARDAGVYTCTASNEVGRVSTSGKVEILGEESSIENAHAPPIFISDESSSALYSNEPRFLRKPRSSEAREGDTVIIECEVIGDPKPEVYWLRDFLKPDYYRDANHFKRVGAGPEYRFEIPHAKFDYTGAYSVIAKNIHGEAKAIISLQILARDPNSSQDAHNIRYGRVEVIPRFEKELTDLLCYDGDAIEFECRISANPDPDIRWFHYSEVVPECPDFESSYDRGTARLKIKQVTAEDEGTYRCEASNSLGKITSSACLVVYPPGEPNTLSQRLRRPPALLSGASTPRSTPRTTPRNTPRTTPARSLSATPDSRRLCSPCREISPKFYTYPFNRVAEEGDTVVFQCAVKGLPPPWATWDKDGIIITASSRITIKEKDEMFRILEIAEVNVEDVGLYRITLENDYGRAEASARLEVISGKGKFHGTRSFSASPSRRALTYRRRTPSFSRQD